MFWYNKEESVGIAVSGKSLAYTANGLNITDFSWAGDPAFLRIRLTSVLDVKDDYSGENGALSHFLSVNGKTVGTATDLLCSCGGFHRDYKLNMPFSFYFENLTGEEMIFVSPERLYMENGAVIFQTSNPAAKSRYLLFFADNGVLHAEGKQLLVTVNEGMGKWRMRYGNSLEELTAVYHKKH